ncbi:MAG: DedA family protein [Trueperaceae bacterium]
MTALLDGLKDLLLGIVETLGYPGLALLSLLENLVPPVPSEFVLPFAGFLVAADRLNGPLVLLATAVGGFVGTTAFYWLGRQLGDAKVRAFIDHYGRYVLLQVADYDQALAFFHKHDVKVVFWGRFVPGIRSLISLPAGVARMPFGPFALFTLLGTVFWNGALLLAGYLLGARWTLVLDVVDRFELVLWAIVFALLAAWVVWRLRARAKHRAS